MTGSVVHPTRSFRNGPMHMVPWLLLHAEQQTGAHVLVVALILTLLPNHCLFSTFTTSKSNSKQNNLLNWLLVSVWLAGAALHCDALALQPPFQHPSSLLFCELSNAFLNTIPALFNGGVYCFVRLSVIGLPRDSLQHVHRSFNDPSSSHDHRETPSMIPMLIPWQEKQHPYEFFFFLFLSFPP